MFSDSFNIENFSPGKILSYILPILLVIPIVFIFSGIGDEYGKLAVVLGIPIIFFSIFYFNFSYSILISLLFLREYLFGFSIVTFFAFFILVSFLLTYKKIDMGDFRSSFNHLFIIYLIFIIPSFLNNEVVGDSLLKSINLLVFFLIVNISFAAKFDYSTKKIFLWTYLFFVVINGLVIIYEGISFQDRVFGFTGVMYVDYVGIAIVISLVLIILVEKKYKVYFLVCSLFCLLALFTTQTRNPLLTIVATSGFLVIYLMKNYIDFSISRKTLLTIVIAAILAMAGLYITVSVINPDVAERTEELTRNNSEILSEEGTASNSLITRIFIWSNAANAVSIHPYVGIGIYSFPYVNYKYNTLPTFLFEWYVKGKTPHITFLAVLVETGIVGLIGFLIFIVGCFYYILSSLKLSKTKSEIKVSLVLFSAQLYIFFSMFVTDAWLWNHGIVLWGIILGLNLANRQYLLSKYRSNNNVDFKLT